MLPSSVIGIVSYSQPLFITVKWAVSHFCSRAQCQFFNFLFGLTSIVCLAAILWTIWWERNAKKWLCIKMGRWAKPCWNVTTAAVATSFSWASSQQRLILWWCYSAGMLLGTVLIEAGQYSTSVKLDLNIYIWLWKFMIKFFSSQLFRFLPLTLDFRTLVKRPWDAWIMKNGQQMKVHEQNWWTFLF